MYNRKKSRKRILPRHLLTVLLLAALALLLCPATSFAAKEPPILKVGNKYYHRDDEGNLVRYKGVNALACKRLDELSALPKKGTAAAKEKALKKAFIWSARSIRHEWYTVSYSSIEAERKGSAKYTFVTLRGDCGNQAAVFATMARVLGYPAKMVRGLIPTSRDKNGNPTGFRSHAWVTIKKKGKTYVYDPNFNGLDETKKLRKKNKYIGYAFFYGDKNTYLYYSLKKKLLT